MSNDCGVQEKWSIGDRIEGVCQCTPSKIVVLEVAQITEDWVWFKDVCKSDVIQCGIYLHDYKTLERATKVNFINGYNKYTYKRIPRKSEDVWQVGDILRGECRCDSNKIIDFEYLGGDKFRDSKDGCIQYCKGGYPSSNLEDTVLVFSVTYTRNYTNWRRVASQQSTLTHQEPKSDSYDPKSMDYEFGDTIKIRGFEYIIGGMGMPGLSPISPYLKKKEPPKKPIKLENGDIIETACNTYEIAGGIPVWKSR